MLFLFVLDLSRARRGKFRKVLSFQIHFSEVFAKAFCFATKVGGVLVDCRYKVLNTKCLRHMEVDGKIFIEREETIITMDAHGKKTTHPYPD